MARATEISTRRSGRRIADGEEAAAVSHAKDAGQIGLTRTGSAQVHFPQFAHSFIKHLLKNQFAYEYFARDRRRSAAWKSEAEFRTLFQVQIGEESKAISTLEKELEDLSSYARKTLGIPIVNDKLAGHLETERQNAEQEKQKNPDFADTYDDIVQGVNEKIYWVNLFQTIKAELVRQGIPLQFEFLIVPQKAFSSSFKESIEDIPIVFPNLQNDPYPLGQIITVLSASKKRKSNFFHLFYTVDAPIDSDQKNELYTLFLQNSL